MIIQVGDLRYAKMCLSGSRVFFKKHGLDWSEFLKTGLPEKVFIETGDSMAIKMVEITRGRK